jgi:hypothetical protein
MDRLTPDMIRQKRTGHNQVAAAEKVLARSPYAQLGPGSPRDIACPETHDSRMSHEAVKAETSIGACGWGQDHRGRPDSR